MERLLNVCCLLIALVALSQWRLGKLGSERGKSPKSMRGLGALVCGLAVLFPVISMTDDLHQMKAVINDVDPSQLVVKSAGETKATGDLHRVTLHSLEIVPHKVTSFRGLSVGRVVNSDSPPASFVLVYRSEGRAPPFLLL